MGPSVRRSSCITYLLYFPYDQTVVYRWKHHPTMTKLSITHNPTRLEPAQLVLAMATPLRNGKTIVRSD